MAVIYSKFGGCLGVTTKFGPLARTDLWAGVKGLLERLMTHLGLGSSLEDPWGVYWGVVVRLSSQEIVLFSWEAWGALCLVEHLRPCLTDLAWLLNWPAGGELLSSPGERWAVTWGVLLPSLGGRWAVAWGGLLARGELLPSLGGRWAIAGGELLPLLEGRWEIAWEELLPSPKGRWALAGGELLPSPGGRSAIAGGELGEELLPSPEGRWAVAGGELLPSLGGRWAIAGGELGGHMLPSLGRRRAPNWLPAEGELLPSLGGRSAIVWEELLVWGGLLPFPGGREVLACLPACEPKLLEWVRFIALALIIFPSFLLIRILNLFNCLCLTLANLISLTLSTKPWHYHTLHTRSLWKYQKDLW